MQNLDQKLKTLGLTKVEIDTYLFSLQNKRVNLKSLAKHLDITIAGASRLFKKMIEKGFIKSVEIGNKKVFLPTDIRDLKKTFLKNLDTRKTDAEQIFDELESGYGDYAIKITRYADNRYVKSIQNAVMDAKKAFEFLDFKNIIPKSKKILTKNYKEKEVKFETVYNTDNDKNKIPWGTRIKLNSDKLYANILSFDNITKFSTSTKETIFIENEEIANSIQAFISEMTKKQK